ncbi:coenzyme F420-0:L-glutamate ligase / coenzyme F420-1:gamma-L-glutamate ligase [Micromonospora pattaloongensis]|uniref:Coenzyme F420-0:L-glutamate ligase / coenzyme F420-1:gamma-L-glutamate ligase n=1 Tax=Micromonospora pattaloongensis TaxID=405436 RepID=A0A1H3M6J4_9ACTN|nr:coenzyme F420-0:L-glutamate ligase / coenzyme F420-1:gamma-L-glutamate ligase [Micromonospora pattaloongensis]
MSGRHSAPEPQNAERVLEILPVRGIGDVTPGDDLAALIGGAAPWLRDGDVLVVTSKIVSKAEGRLVDVPTGEPERAAAREEVLAAETARPVARRGPTRIVQTHHGFVMAAAGIDASNVDASRLVLLPKDPDASARALRAALRERHGVDVAVIVSDTMGRPWRNGLTDVALGAAGIGPIRDHRGETDPYGNELSITQMAVIDELAGAGELVKGKCDQVPVAVVRGYLAAAEPDDGPGAVALVRDAAQDLFSLGTAEATAAGLLAAATLADGTAPPHAPVDPAAVARAIAAVAAVIAPGTAFTHTTDPEVRQRLAPQAPRGASGLILCRLPAPATPGDLIRLGADLHRLRAALAAEAVASTPLAVPASDDDRPLAALLAV